MRKRSLRKNSTEGTIVLIQGGKEPWGNEMEAIFFIKSTMLPNECGKWWRGSAAQPTLVVSASAQLQVVGVLEGTRTVLDSGARRWSQVQLVLSNCMPKTQDQNRRNARTD